MNKIGFGGGCHWCTEAVFQSLIGVLKVEQGWVASDFYNQSFSEAVLVYFDPTIIFQESLIAIHLHTHSCTSKHSMREKYRSAVYTFSEEQAKIANTVMLQQQSDFDKPVLTQVLPFVSFRENQERYRNYYLKNSGNQFCTNYINPKLNLLRKQFSKHFIQLIDTTTL